MLFHGEDGVRHNHAEAAGWYKRASIAGDAISSRCLGKLHLDGLGVVQSNRKAAVLFRQAAEAGDAIAQRHLGLQQFYGSENGDGTHIKPDKVEAKRLFELSAAKGDCLALRYLGSMNLFGDGIPCNKPKARDLYARAVSCGDVMSMTTLASMLFNADGVPQDKIRAVELYETASTRGDVMATEHLASMYLDGDGIPKDLSRAALLYKRAMEQSSVVSFITEPAELRVRKPALAGIDENEGVSRDDISCSAQMQKAVKALREELKSTQRALKESKDRESVLTDGYGFTVAMRLRHDQEKALTAELDNECPVCFLEGGEHAAGCPYGADQWPECEV